MSFIIWTSDAPDSDSIFAEAQIILAIYDKPVRVLLQEMIEELAPQKGQRFSKEHAIAWFGERYPKIKRGTISAHLIRFSTNAPNRLHYSAKLPMKICSFKSIQATSVSMTRQPIRGLFTRNHMFHLYPTLKSSCSRFSRRWMMVQRHRFPRCGSELPPNWD